MGYIYALAFAAFWAIAVVYPVTVYARLTKNWKSASPEEKRYLRLIAALGFVVALVFFYALAS